jgi:hypothetical protein
VAASFIGGSAGLHLTQAGFEEPLYMACERLFAKAIFLALNVVAAGGWLYLLTRFSVALIQMIR